MLQIVIVDDEVLIREGLARMIAKESREFQVTGTYGDGKLLLDELDPAHVDVVITDIRMPQIDGLELIKQLKASHPRIRCILMSGFVEFNYAREAIRSSAVDYLLKPINKEQLFELLYSLDEERRLLQDKEQRQRSGLLLTLLHLEEPSPTLLSSLNLPQPHFLLLVLKASSSEVLEAYSNRLRQEQDGLFDSLELRQGRQAWIWYSPEPLGGETLAAIRSRLLAVNGQQLHVGYSRTYTSPAQLRQAYLEASTACDAGIYSPELLHYAGAEQLHRQEGNSGDPFASCREGLIHDLQILDAAGVMERIRQLFCMLQSQQATTVQILRVCRLLEETAAAELQEFEPFYRSVAGRQLEEQLESCMAFADMETLFSSAFSAALHAVRTSRLEMSGTAVETVKRWITANYNQHSELNALAHMVYLTPSYLSKLFKQETGLTLTDYIIEIRIRRAKQLLKQSPDLKVHEIGAEVGYADPAYFNKLFKRVVGVTPSEYKRISMV